MVAEKVRSPRRYGGREVWWPINIVKGDLGVARGVARFVPSRAVGKLH